MSNRVVVMKIGGSVLTALPAFGVTAAALARVVRTASWGPTERRGRFVIVVSAEAGVTDRLLDTANAITSDPDQTAVDLLLSTGELRSVALLVLALQRQGVRAVAANVHQTELFRHAPDAQIAIRPLRLHALLDSHDVVVVPGFLACTLGDGMVSLGRGGSDLTAVLLAAGLRATRCELIKDVGAYYTADPRMDQQARPLPALNYTQALEMADNGCALVQREALEAARAAGVPLVVRSLHGTVGSVVVGDQGI
jgi:aspartate kinase